jgi:hypothetical protein
LSPTVNEFPGAVTLSDCAVGVGVGVGVGIGVGVGVGGALWERAPPQPMRAIKVRVRRMDQNSDFRLTANSAVYSVTHRPATL